MITAQTQNGDAADVFVSVTDKNTSPPSLVMNRQRLNYGSPAVQLGAQEDGAGRFNVDWVAERFDDPNHRSSGNEVKNDGDLFYVTAG